METPSQSDAQAPSHDPLVGVPSHKVATAAGAVIGAVAAGAAIGTAAGPIGTLIGAAVGAVAGGLGGDAVANAVDPAHEAAHWRDHYRSRPYVGADARFEDFGPAYVYGVVSYTRHADRSFEDIESDLERDWAAERGESSLEWPEARPAARDAWERVAQAPQPNYDSDADRPRSSN